MRTKLLLSILFFGWSGVAQAQTGVCLGGNSIIQCNSYGAGDYVADLAQFESDNVQAYLAIHQLPSTDSALIYQYGRADLRNELRSFMFNSMKAIIVKPAAQRSVHEQNLVNWFHQAVYQNELTEYQFAVAEYKKWQSNPCSYTLDPVIAQQYNLSYDGTPFCEGIIGILGGFPVPDPNYFLAVGLKNSYNLPLANTPSGAIILGQTPLYSEANLAYAAIPAAGAGGATGILYGIGVIAPYAFSTPVQGITGLTWYLVGPQFVDTLDVVTSSVAEAGGPAAILLAAALIGIQAGMQDYQAQQNQDAAQSQEAYLARLQSGCGIVDLTAMMNDTSGVGSYKLQTTFLAVTLPDVPSTQPLPQHRQGSDPVITASQFPGPQNVSTYASFTYLDWTGVEWNATLYGGWFVQSQVNNPAITSITPTILFTDLNGQPRSASRIGTNFLITKSQPASTDVACPADPASGITLGNTTGCIYYVSSDLNLYDYSAQESLYYEIVTPPAFKGPATATFTGGKFGQFELTASTNNPYLTVVFSANGTLPSGFALSLNGAVSSLDFTGITTMSGTYTVPITATAGSYPFIVSTTQNLTVNVIAGDQITSPATLSAFVQQPVNFLITTSGTANPMISLANLPLPAGLSFHDNGNGTARIFGTPTAAYTPSCSMTFCGVQTNFGAQQALQITVTYPHAPGFISPNAWTFTTGVNGYFGLITAGSGTNLFISSCPASSSPTGLVVSNNAAVPLPNGASFLTFIDTGNGRGVIVGNPPSSAAGASVTVCVVSEYSYSYPSIQAVTLNFTGSPEITSQGSYQATTQTAFTYSIQTTGATTPITNVNGTSLYTLPTGTSALYVDETLKISGTPAPGSGGLYTLPVTVLTNQCSASSASASLAGSVDAVVPALQAPNASSAAPVEAPSATQIFTLEVDEAPTITSSKTALFLVNTSNSFRVTTQGFPRAQLPPNAPSGDQPMRVLLTSGSLPAGITFSDLSNGAPTGTGILSGTPTTTGTFPLTFTASNGVGSPYVQKFNLIVTVPGGENLTSGSACNGVYGGSFKGNVTISWGQNCTFVSGGITGNVTVNGGNLALTNMTVGGNVQVNGGSFAIGPGTIVKGDLQIQKTAASSARNQVCGAGVLGNLQFQNNGTAVEIGSANPAGCAGNVIRGNLEVCNNIAATTLFGNTVGGNLEDLNNMAPTQVFRNDICHSLECRNNSSITGGGNVAKEKQGQCSAF